MTTLRTLTLAACVLLTALTGTLCSCKHGVAPDPTNPDDPGTSPIETPYTAIPDEYVGTWYSSRNDGPLTDNWANKTFQGEQGYAEFRTMVFTKDGKNAVEYTTEVFNTSTEIRQRFYRIVGTLEYKTSPTSITFHAQKGTMRVFSNRSSGYQENPISLNELRSYQTVWEKPQATNIPNATNLLTGTIIDQHGRYSVEYKKVTSGSATSPTGLPSTSPITGGSSVKIGDLYYPTVSIGNQEWLATNYAGPGSLKEAAKPQYGTFMHYNDLKSIPLPTGWRVPSRQDYEKLLRSQGLTVYEWGTDGDDLTSRQLLGKLMAPNVWMKQDGYANNQSGFNAMPADVRRPSGTNNGEGANCVLWIADKTSQDEPMVFNLIQMPSRTYARFTPQAISYFPELTPVRLVRDK
ncbi:FISUMP domain-containing protein [Fibrella sp. WM1]|uniref:FISUMP domain-containing protein n=1 Tax=Fibrella musci TaxID=3242485 RepID=UPI0035214ED9